MNVELKSRAKLHSDTELHNEENAHSNFEVSTHDKDVELSQRNMHSDSEAERLMWKQGLNQDYIIMSRDTALLKKSLEIRITYQ